MDAAAVALDTVDPPSSPPIVFRSDGCTIDCTMEANRCLTVWSQQLSLAWADCRGELLFNRVVFKQLATAHYSTLHSRLLEGCFVSDQRLDRLIGFGEERHKVLVKTIQGARDLGACGSPVRVLSDRFVKFHTVLLLHHTINFACAFRYFSSRTSPFSTYAVL